MIGINQTKSSYCKYVRGHLLFKEKCLVDIVDQCWGILEMYMLSLPILMPGANV